MNREITAVVRIVLVVAVLIVAAATVRWGAAWLTPNARAMSDERIRAEAHSLHSQARTLPWAIAWVPALRHGVLSDELCRRLAVQRDPSLWSRGALTCP